VTPHPSSSAISHNIHYSTPEWGGRCFSRSIVSMIPIKRASACDLHAEVALAKNLRS
jgi:hypothetical protein